MRIFCFLNIMLAFIACSSQQNTEKLLQNSAEKKEDSIVSVSLYCNEKIKVGAEITDAYFPQLTGKKIAVVGNQTSMVGNKHLVDTLLAAGINVVKVFSPEHGFRGKAEAGEKVIDGIDKETGLPVISLYGNNKKPTAAQLENVDIILFDIQDVGVRFYTYISTLHYVMEAAAEQNKAIIVLDRPNPNGHYVDGPVLNTKFKSFVGMHEVPVVHGMTIGEYAQMINGEGWLADGNKAALSVISCEGWNHNMYYELPFAPSPNLKTMRGVYLYPSLCFFEGTVVSLGRGTDWPFEVIGHPNYKLFDTTNLFQFTPLPNAGSAHPVLEGQLCFGYSFSNDDITTLREKRKLDLSYLIDFYENLKLGEKFFLASNFINNLAGTNELKEQIIAGKTLVEIEESWQTKLKTFKQTRKQYLLYKDFE